MIEETSSFRDPSGVVYYEHGSIKRSVSLVYKEHYDSLMRSGLYQTLVEENLLIPHKEFESKNPSKVYKILEPELIPFISYPYEWTFAHLKAAALLTLKIQRKALEHHMSLKDASAFNIQFKGVHPIFIDTLSFETLNERQPWVAYRQFCMHFLAPLLLISNEPRFRMFSQTCLDGFDLHMASALLPCSSWLSLGPLFHIHLHALMERKSHSEIKSKRTLSCSKKKLLNLIRSLETTIETLQQKKQHSTHWEHYYQSNTYSHEEFNAKSAFVLECVQGIKPEILWDLGANTGFFSRQSAQHAQYVVSFDYDHGCVNRLYQELSETTPPSSHILPLTQNLAAPSPSLGWAHQERQSLRARGPAHMAIALALVHHLAIADNIPLEMIAKEFSEYAYYLVIEFVEPDDVRAAQLLEGKPCLRERYNHTIFLHSFQQYFEVLRSESAATRSLYFMKKR